MTEENEKRGAYGDGHCATLEEIAEELGVTMRGAHHILGKALRKFRVNWIKMFGEPPEFDNGEDFANEVLHGYARVLKMREVPEGEIIRDICEGGEVDDD